MSGTIKAEELLCNECGRVFRQGEKRLHNKKAYCEDCLKSVKRRGA